MLIFDQLVALTKFRRDEAILFSNLAENGINII
jgi:hypothetical protein